MGDDVMVTMLQRRLDLLKLQQKLTAPTLATNHVVESVRLAAEQLAAANQATEPLKIAAKPLAAVAWSIEPLKNTTASFATIGRFVEPLKIPGSSPKEQRLQAKIAKLEAELGLNQRRSVPASPPVTAAARQPQLMQRAPTSQTPPSSAATSSPGGSKRGRPTQRATIVDTYVRWLFAREIAPSLSFEKIAKRLGDGKGDGFGKQAVSNALHAAGLGDEAARSSFLLEYEQDVDAALGVCRITLAAAVKARRKKAF